MGLKTITRSAIGRNAVIGDLYNIRNDSFIGISVLNDSIPEDSILTTAKSDINIKHIDNETICEKFNNLEIEPELKMSILSDLIHLEGYAKYYTHVKTSQNYVQKSVAITNTNCVEELVLTRDKAEELISKDAVTLDSATHFVFAITWGTKIIITLEELKSENAGKLKEKLMALVLNIQGISHELDNDTDPIDYNVFTDIPPYDDPPTTLMETEIYVKKSLKLMQFSNKKKGRPLIYTLMPIQVLNDYISTPIPMTELYSIDEQLIDVCIGRYDDVTDILLQLKNVLDHFEAHSNCIPIEQVKEGMELKNNLENDQMILKSQLKKLVPTVRSGKPATCLEQLFGPLEFNWVNQQNIWLEKIEFVRQIKQLGVQYAGNGTFVEGITQIIGSNGLVYVLFFGTKLQSETDNSWKDVKNFFLQLIAYENALFVVVDLDVRPELLPESYENKMTISSYSRGKCVDSDVYATHVAETMKCLAKGYGHQPCQKPHKRVNLELVCPGSLRGNCEDDEHLWHCFLCNDQLMYGFDGHFYCLCGKSKCDNFIFKCCSKKHNFEFIAFPQAELRRLVREIPPMEEINILVLGVTGVGKSTWLNAFANYIMYPSLKDAAHKKLHSVTSSWFQLTDEENVVHDVQFGEDDNEVHGHGRSSTQTVRGHLFPIGNTLLRLIDTPGIGDNRGIEQDKENLARILAYLRGLDKIHCICILLKPNESKLHILFEFCIKELLMHLHRSALKNIVFCFTHSRTTFYKPGDTRMPLDELLKQKRIPIVLDPRVMYCMDNESFRFLCAKNQGIPFDENIEKTFSESWDITVKEINRLLTHIRTLEPHVIGDTISLNDARKNIICLAKPIADISANIQRNLTQVEWRREQLLTQTARVDELLQMLYVDVTVLKSDPLTYPRTVCGSSKCVTYHTIANANSNSIEYSTICHEKCDLKDVPVEIIGDRRIKSCYAMDCGRSLYCRICGCSWDQHLHIRYTQRAEIKREAVKHVQDEVSVKKSESEIIKGFITQLETLTKELEQEQQIIFETSVKFGCYLSKNAIVPYNDVIERYIDHLIEKEHDKFAVTKNDDLLKRLVAIRDMYTVEVEALKRAMAEPNAEELSYAEFRKLLQILYKLKHNGKQLQDAFEQASKCEEIKNEHCERFHEPQQLQRGYGQNFYEATTHVNKRRVAKNKHLGYGNTYNALAVSEPNRRLATNAISDGISWMKRRIWK